MHFWKPSVSPLGAEVQKPSCLSHTPQLAWWICHSVFKHMLSRSTLRSLCFQLLMLQIIVQSGIKTFFIEYVLLRWIRHVEHRMRHSVFWWFCIFVVPRYLFRGDIQLLHQVVSEEKNICYYPCLKISQTQSMLAFGRVLRRPIS